jgi:hypothetical protein
VTLPEHYRLFEGWNQWINWDVREREGKLVKVPVDAGGRLINAQDPAKWMTYEAALANGRPVGFVFQDSDPFFFVDVDKALVDGVWNQTAQWIRQQLPTAVFEVSQSGTGFHLFGRYSSIPPHGNKREDIGLELYTGGRFCACTFDRSEAGPVHDLTEQISAIASAYFPPEAAGSGGDVEKVWVEAVEAGVRPAWDGPEDDGELITKALTARGSVKRAFGATLSFGDLWSGNVPEDGKSEADAALCADLAFWTGCDVVRMERLFSASALGQRDKWIDRGYYRHRTILFAARTCQNVYRDPKAVIDPANAPTIAELGVVAQLNPGMASLPVDRQTEYFKGCVWISDIKRIFTPRALLMDQQQFDAYYGGFNFEMEIGNPQDTTKSAFEAFTRSRAIRFPKADTSGFRPLDPSGCIYPEDRGGGLVVVNTYAPPKPLCVKGDISPFLDYVQRILPGKLNRDVTLSYLCSAAQNPGVKFQWCLFLQGVEGSGKTFLIEALTAAVGREDYVTSANVKDIGNVFNSNYYRKLLVVLEEVNAHESPSMMGAIKALITNRRIEYQPKGLTQFTGDNCANFILTANNKTGILKTANDRRYACVYIAPQSVEDLAAAGLTERYFELLWDWFDNRGGREAINYWLHNTAPIAAYDPAGSAKRAPVTENTLEAIALGGSEPAAIIAEAIASEVYGCRGPWLSYYAVSMLFSSHRGIDRRQIASAIEELGYEKHPGLAGGRAGSAIPGEGRTRLYYRPGSPAGALRGRAIVDAYLKAQNHPEATECSPPLISNSGAITPMPIRPLGS